MIEVDKSGDRVQQMFGEIAPKYDRMNHLLSMNTDRYWRWWTVRKLAKKVDGPVLDVCTGTGDLAIAFSRKLGSKHEVVGADFCREMLEFGEEKKARLAIEDMHFLQADNNLWRMMCLSPIRICSVMKRPHDDIAQTRQAPGSLAIMSSARAFDVVHHSYTIQVGVSPLYDL